MTYRLLGKRQEGSVDGLEKKLDELHKKHDNLSIGLSQRLDALDKKSDDTQQMLIELSRMLAFLDRLERAMVELGRMQNILREEVSVIVQRPGQPAQAGSGDSALVREYVAASRMRELYPTDLFPGLDRVSLPVGAIHEESEHVNQVDLLYVAGIAKLRGCRRMFEFGTYQGRTTYHLTFASENPRVFSLNLPPDKDPSVASFLGSWFKGTDRERFITQILEDSRSFDPAPYERQMDLVFVDGDHSYEAVKNDSEKALRMLAPGGIILWHDFAAKTPGIVRYMKEFSQQRPVFRLKHTCLVAFIDGMDVEGYVPPARRGSWLSGAEARE
jgi:predicted O-methyltransferase YrrM